MATTLAASPLPKQEALRACFDFIRQATEIIRELSAQGDDPPPPGKPSPAPREVQAGSERKAA